MNGTIRILAILLVIQAGLFFALDSKKQTGEPFQAEESLLGLELSSLDTIVIRTPDRKALELEKEGDRWILPLNDNFPVSQSKLEEVAAKLFDMKKSWPVATTSISAKQFKVAPTDFEKKISFMKDGEEKKVLYLGSSPGFKKIHVRVDGSDNVYAVNFAAYEIPIRAQDWSDPDYLKLPVSDVKSISIPAGTLVQKEGKFEMEGGNADTDESNSVALAITGMPYLEVLGTEDKEAYGLKTPAFETSLTKTDGTEIGYKFGKPEGATNYYLKRSDGPYYYKLMTTAVERFKDYTPEPPAKESEVENQETTDVNAPKSDG